MLELVEEADPLEAVDSEDFEVLLVLVLPLPVDVDPSVAVAVAVADAALPVIAPGPWFPLRVKYRLTAVSLGAWSLLTVAPVVGWVTVASAALNSAAKSVVGAATPDVDRKSHKLWEATLATDS